MKARRVHDAFLDALWDASGVHAAAPTAQLLLYVANHIRRHPDFDALGLERVTRRLDDLRARQSDNAEPLVGPAAVNRLIHEIVDAFEDRHHNQEHHELPAAKAG
jgi:hypothetical protein